MPGVRVVCQGLPQGCLPTRNATGGGDQTMAARCSTGW
jgi:hypothetical protein